ncbi:MAG: ISAs1 family transposase, partial [Opitutaceae bacterium]|nr:ISAs1 family transposase [Opitutaceae bacterium]
MDSINSPINYLLKLKDPRVERTKLHPMENIALISIMAIICGDQTWEDIENYGITKKSWLETFLDLSNDIPSHDIFNRFFRALDPKALESYFLEWVKEVAKLTKGEVVSIDGKTLRGTKNRKGKILVHRVSAWANANNLVLGQVKVDDKSNEITAIPKLLDVLMLNDCIVTIDAMGCQTEIVEKITDKGADYILTVKSNQECLEREAKAITGISIPSSQSEQIEDRHGRIEKRRCFVFDDLPIAKQLGRRVMINSIIKVETERYDKASDKYEEHTRLYISSLKVSAEDASKYIRSHWGIENRLHWTLDVSFGEDQSRKRAGFAAQNFSVINRIALNL